MKTLAEHMSIYQHDHTKDSTKMTHYLGVPLVTFSLLILLGWIHLSMSGVFTISFAWLFVATLLAYYYVLDWQLALVTTVMMIPTTLLASIFSHAGPTKFNIMFFLVTFTVGAILQVIGHIFEGKLPTFTHHAFQVFIAPIFLVAEMAFARGYKQDLQADVLRLAAQEHS